jgi:DNA anti-recombination protein RmuC
MDLEVVDALKAAGVPDDKARAVVVSLHREIDQRYAAHAGQLATRGDLVETRAALAHDLAEVKAELKRDLVDVRVELKRDLADVRAELKQDLAELRAELKHDLAEVSAELTRGLAEVRAELKGDVAGVRLEVSRLDTRLAETKSELIRWSVGSFVALSGVVMAAFKLMAH